MRKNSIALIINFCICFLITPIFLFSQKSALSCSDFKFGTFYFYPKNTHDFYIERIDEKYLHEKNMVTGDTVLWEIKWKNDCVYSLKFIATNEKMNSETESLLKHHNLVYEIDSKTDNYFTVKGFLDKNTNIPIQFDTMWLNEKTTIQNNELFKKVPNATVLKRSHFSDTSKYAVMYIYRPGKFTNSLGNFLVYFDNNLLCVAENKTGYIFKILKEGQFEIKSRLLKDESAIKLDVSFGKTYYVKSMIHWTISKRLYNFKLEMKNVPAEIGKNEFEEVNLK